MTLSKEKLAHYAAHTEGPVKAMARELLERRERDGQEPVYQCMEDGNWYDTEKRLYEEVKENGNMCRILYAAPPAPVVQPVQVQDERASYEAFVEQRLGDCVDRRRAKNGDQEYMAWDMAMGWIVWQGRAALLKQPSSIQGRDDAVSDAEIKQPASNSPAVPDGWVACSERMPEEYDFDIWVFSLSKGVHDGVHWDGEVFADDEYQFKIIDASHWMKKIYPEAPKQESE